MTETAQDALHAALREACEKAATRIASPIKREVEIPGIRDIIKRELTPVVEALAGAAYKACADMVKGLRYPYPVLTAKGMQEHIAQRIAALTPESAARALREHDKERDAIVLALHNVMEHVYAQNDYTTRDYEKYYAAVDAARVALTPYRNPKNGELLASPSQPAVEDKFNNGNGAQICPNCRTILKPVWRNGDQE